jgi:hypothetical protein
MNKEFSIMNNNPPYWYNQRYNGSERHEVFEGRTGNRKKSIEDGLVIFTSSEFHRTGKFSIHLSPKQWEEKTNMKKIAVEQWCKYYNKTEEEFRERYGRLPL